MTTNDEDITQFNAKGIGLDYECMFTVHAHAGSKAIEMGNELNDMFGPMMTDLQMAAETDVSTPEGRELYQKKLGDAMKGIYKQLPPGKLLPLAKKILAHTKAAKTGGTEPVVYDLGSDGGFDSFFKRNTKSLIPLMKSVVEFNGFLEMDVSALFFETAAQETTAQGAQ